jgi:uncharacterized RDD family membrane protein YckC
MDELQHFEKPIVGYEQTGILKKNIAGIIDAILIFFLTIIITLILIYLRFIKQDNLNFLDDVIYFFSTFILYRLVLIFLLTGTIGMRILGIRYMTETSLKLSAKEKMLAALMIYINGVGNYNLT